MKQEMNGREIISMGINKIQIVKRIIAIALTVTCIALAGVTIVQRAEIKDEKTKQAQIILDEREEITNGYKDFKQGISKDILSLVANLEGTKTLTFESKDINDMSKSLKAIMAAVDKNEQIKRITVMDEFNFDIYESTVLLREDLRGFVVSFTTALNDKNFNTLDSSLKYLQRIVEKVNYIDGKIEEI